MFTCKRLLTKAISLYEYIYSKYSTALKYHKYKKEFKSFKNQSDPNRFRIMWQDRYPCLEDRTRTTGFDRHYVFHTAWAAGIIAHTRPATHIDLSSYIYFASLISAFVPVCFFDLRPVKIGLNNLQSGSLDIKQLPFRTDSVLSLSCMHVVEHIGLGRYGDAIDPDGDLKAIEEIKRVLAPGGDLIIVVPIGSAKIMFNAHRIYTYSQIKNYFKDFHLKEFSLIPDKAESGGLVRNATEEMANRQEYGCGCFWFKG